MESCGSTALAAWLDATVERAVPVGISVDDAMDRAETLAKELERPGAALEWSDELPDILHALCRFLQLGGESSEQMLGIAKSAYEAVVMIRWPHQMCEEKNALLATLAYFVWNTSRNIGLQTEMRLFGQRCEKHVEGQGSVGDFLALPFSRRTTAINSSFLSDPPVLLVTLSRLCRLANSAPSEGALGGRQLFEWLCQVDETSLSEERAWFAVQAAIATAGALRQLGEVSEAGRWLESAESLLQRVSCGSALLLQIEYAKLTILHSRRQLNALLERLPMLVEALELRVMKAELAKARFLGACALKDAESELAFGAFETLVQRPEIRRDSLLLGLSLMHIGDLHGARGDYAAATQLFAQALPSLEESGISWALADFHAVVAEKLRDQGFLSAAVDGYRSAIVKYLEQGLSLRVSYIRVLLAETLTVTGREEEALGELVAALPVIERESLEKDGVVAIALLRKALSRSRADTDALRTLRVQLDRARKSVL